MKMKIKATKRFANYINEVAKKEGFEVFASIVKMDGNTYKWNVGEPFDAYDYGDYDWNSEQFVAIALEYPSDYYAAPMYLSTKTLTEEFKRQGVVDIKGLDSMIRDLCEI